MKKSFVAFRIFGLGGCLWFLFDCNNMEYYTYEVFGRAIIIGRESSTMRILSTTLIASFIGFNIDKNSKLKKENKLKTNPDTFTQEP